MKNDKYNKLVTDILSEIDSGSQEVALSLAEAHWQYVGKLLIEYGALKIEKHIKKSFQAYQCGFISGFVNAIKGGARIFDIRWDQFTQGKECEVDTKKHFMFSTAYEHGFKHGNQHVISQPIPRKQNKCGEYIV